MAFVSSIEINGLTEFLWYCLVDLRPHCAAASVLETTAGQG